MIQDLHNRELTRSFIVINVHLLGVYCSSNNQVAFDCDHGFIVKSSWNPGMSYSKSTKASHIHQVHKLQFLAKIAGIIPASTSPV
ncbi:unnamed protein product [Peronospora belbahrii]|uniref:Uncharacterized protein n=1 Tax=Peronospora belbahrii TaxID=622444 RepID=A0ABN8D174_9STRA|nr:unnamed protein product [Peronospora belbahrii]